MEPLNFIYWLQGYLELQHPSRIDTKQIRIIQDHLELVLKKETPTRQLHNQIISDVKDAIDWDKELNEMKKEDQGKVKLLSGDYVWKDYPMSVTIPASC